MENLDLTSWSPPELGILKLNFNRSCVCDLGLAGYGGIIRNGSGDTLISFVGPLPMVP